MNSSRQFAVDVVQQLRSNGYEAYWAGGCVRDLIMGSEPHDFDVATNATPDQVRRLFGSRRTRMVGACFGVVIVHSEQRDQQHIEVATFRTDASYSDGRRPDAVTFSTAENDAQRRDFTINGMFFDPLSDQVIDYVGGREDLQRKLIRAIGDPHARLAEDKLRMLRAVRFAARFGFSIEPDTYAAIKTHADDIKIVSGERIAVELHKTLMTDHAAWAVEAFVDLGVMQLIAPEIAAAWPRCHYSMIEHVRAAQSNDWTVRLAALYWPLVAIEIDANTHSIANWSSNLKDRLKLSNEECEAFQFSLESQSMLEQAPDLPWSNIQPLLIKPHSHAAVELLETRAHLDSRWLETCHWIRSKLALPDEQLNPLPLLVGQDLLNQGLLAGPEFKVILQRARDLQLDGHLSDREMALEWLKSNSDR